MSELQIGLLVIGALVVIGVLVYNRIQESRAGREAQRAFHSGHEDVLLDQPIAAQGAELLAEPSDTPREAMRIAPRVAPPEEPGQPDPAIDYVIEIESRLPVAQGLLREQWTVIERRHARRALLAGSDDGRSWRAGLQLVSRDGAIGEADLIEFRSAVETLAASVGATVSATEMRAAVEAAHALNDFCAETDIQVVVQVIGGPFAGTRIRAAAEASGLALEADGRFAMRDDAQRLLYTLGAQDGTAFTAEAMRHAAPQALSLALDVTRAPDTRRAFEGMAHFAQQLAALLGGSIVDDNGNALDERAVTAIAVQLDSVRARLDARGVPPGSPVAMRLYS